MWLYILKRLLLMIPTLFGVLLLTFVVIQFVPGGPVEQYLAEARTAADRGARLTGLQQEVVELMEQKVAALRRHLAASGDDANAAARNAVREMQFLQKLAHEIEELE